MKNNRQPRNYSVIWALAGVYLIYLGGELLYGIIRGTETTHTALGLIFGVFFLAVGAALLVREWRLYRGVKQEDTEDSETADWSDEEAPELPEEEEKAEETP